MSFGSSRLGGTSTDHRKHLAQCVKLLLLWVAASDGKVDESELNFASSQLPDSAGVASTEQLLAIIRDADMVSIEKAIVSLADESRELRTAFLDLAIAMSMADHRIAITENHILRFYADALHLGAQLLKRRFQAITGAKFSQPGDPGDPEWWEQVKPAEREIAEAEQHHEAKRMETPDYEDPAEARRTRAEAFAVLGLGANATAEDIDVAYENLAAIFQVDRVSEMGEAAVTVAHEKFKRIQEAYDFLQGS